MPAQVPDCSFTTDQVRLPESHYIVHQHGQQIMAPRFCRRVAHLLPRARLSQPWGLEMVFGSRQVGHFPLLPTPSRPQSSAGTGLPGAWMATALRIWAMPRMETSNGLLRRAPKHAPARFVPQIKAPSLLAVPSVRCEGRASFLQGRRGQTIITSTAILDKPLRALKTGWASSFDGASWQVL